MSEVELLALVERDEAKENFRQWEVDFRKEEIIVNRNKSDKISEAPLSMS